MDLHDAPGVGLGRRMAPQVEQMAGCYAWILALTAHAQEQNNHRIRTSHPVVTLSLPWPWPFLPSSFSFH
jgi:hypothetical protein